MDNRIIPARAGFTGPETEITEDRTDHPRSRGVYDWFDTPYRKVWGSSPLARGLRGGGRRGRRRRRIIPARAGFTAPGDRRSAPWRDHPRSRGVYCIQVRSGFRGSGSSPLARGLRTRTPESDAIIGIIPARAGFTHSIAYQYQAAEDHPRSRGVYPARVLAVAEVAGSSPLARGLHLRNIPFRIERGIIPARAGFTVDRYPDDLGRKDHPRSRGVYVTSVT